MSLIQVSSNSRREANSLQQQEGYRFSNTFNGVMEVPPFSEIALHSGQFTIELGGGVVNFEMIGGTNGNSYPAVRYQFAPTADTYMIDQEDTSSTPSTCSTTAPFMYFVPRKKFASVEAFWTEMVEYLKLDPRPQLQATYAEDGTQTSGISVDTLITNSVQTPTFTITSNICPATTSPISASVFKTLLLGTDAITLSPTGTITKSSGTQGKGAVPASFFTQGTGIHNGGGKLVIGSFSQPAMSLSNNTLNEMVIGIKRWGYKNSPTDMSIGWSQMETCGNLNMNDYVARTDAPTLIGYLSSSFMFSQGGYGLPKDSVCEYAYHITGKSTGFGGSDRTGIVSKGWTTTAGEMCCNILKYEVGAINGEGSPTNPRWTIIATGDPMLNTTLNIPYSKELDPESNLATWDGIDMVSTGTNNGATDNQIIITGNKVSFLINGQAVRLLTSSTQVGTGTLLTDFISDGVYPLQVAGTMFKTQNAFTDVNITPANEQTLVKNLGRTYADFSKYKALRQIIPAEIYNNNFNDITPRCFYPYEVAPTRSEPTTIGINAGRAVEADTFLYLDTTEDGDVKELSTPINYQPNIRTLVGCPDARISFVSEDDYATATNDYSVDVIQNPMLIGLYVRLKNLTQKTTMGSINSVDNDKLIAVVNRYDHTNDDLNLTGFPIYTYNEYDRLYVALNNPSPLYLSQLDFEIVDKFGSVISAIKTTTLVLHLRPATYRDLYGYKKGT